MKKLIFMLSAVFFLFAACEKEVDSTDPASATPESGFHKITGGATTFTTPMIAGGGTYDDDCTGIEVGYITVTKTDNLDEGENCVNITYDVTYTIDLAGWVIDATQLYIGPEGLIPASGKPGSGKRNPKIGHFEFNDQHVPGIPSYSYSKTVPCDENTVIAAHADVRLGDPYPLPYTVETFCEDLPATATVYIIIGLPVSYMTTTITDAGWLNGTYEGWCIDEEHGINVDSSYVQSDVYCTTNEEADHLVLKPDNFDNLNWLLNQGFVGKISTCDGLAYTAMDVQHAIWYLMDDYEPPLTEQNCRQTELEDLALNDGEGFVPGCGDYVAVAFDPSYTNSDGNYVNRQKVIITYPLECDQSETAWGYGFWEDDDQETCADGAQGRSFTNSDYFYGGKAWGWYFYGWQPISVPAP